MLHLYLRVAGVEGVRLRCLCHSSWRRLLSLRCLAALLAEKWLHEDDAGSQETPASGISCEVTRRGAQPISAAAAWSQPKQWSCVKTTSVKAAACDVPEMHPRACHRVEGCCRSLMWATVQRFMPLKSGWVRLALLTNQARYVPLSCISMTNFQSSRWSYVEAESFLLRQHVSPIIKVAFSVWWSYPKGNFIL